jgi:hypothetical protein
MSTEVAVSGVWDTPFEDVCIDMKKRARPELLKTRVLRMCKSR